MTQISLSGRTAIITGASRGIGRSIALAYASAGADVVLAARDEQRLAEVAREITTARALPVRTDVTDADQVKHLAARAVEEFGRVDVLVNNSGVLSSKALLDTTPEEWDRVLNTNLRGVFLATRAVGEHMVRQRSGKIINIASNFAFTGVAGHSAYSASKAAVVAFTRSMAIEWAPQGIQVNALAPGYVATDLNADVRADEETMSRILRGVPARRMAEPGEISPWAVLLASSTSDFMTGETIVIDGGQVAR